MVGRTASVSGGTSASEGENLLPSFFARNGLDEADLVACHEFASARFPQYVIEAAREQGGCSYSLVAEYPYDPEGSLLGNFSAAKTIVQFRLVKHTLDMRMAEAARQVSYLAPKTWSLGGLKVGNDVVLQVVAMTWKPGHRFSDVQPQSDVLKSKDFSKMRMLLRCLARFLAETWKSGRTGVEHCSGKVGKSLVSRLKQLARDLPTRALRAKAEQVATAVEGGALDALPIVLTHGDLLPSNILVATACWRITGIIDWAEAEWLPFGVCLYGLEHLLGYMETALGRSPRYVYYQRADELKDEFWSLLVDLVPVLDDTKVLQQVDLARDVGILLWRGFAWDDGAIDRVVNVADDGEEVACLEAFLGVHSTARRHDSMFAETRPLVPMYRQSSQDHGFS